MINVKYKYLNKEKPLETKRLDRNPLEILNQKVIVTGSMQINAINHDDTALLVTTGSVAFVQNWNHHQGFFYTALPITSSAGRINGKLKVETLIVNNEYGHGDGNLYVQNNTYISGSIVIVPNNRPKVPETGMIYFDNTDLHFYGWNGNEWKQLNK